MDLITLYSVLVTLYFLRNTLFHTEIDPFEFTQFRQFA